MKCPLRHLLQSLIVFHILLVASAYAAGNEFWTGFGMPGVDGEVRAMTVSGSDIYLGGRFVTAAGINVGGIVRWNIVEHRWYPLGDPKGYPGVNGVVHAIAVKGEEVYIGGEFTSAGGVRARNLAIFNTRTKQWSDWGGGAVYGLNGAIFAIAVQGNDVIVGGYFSVIGTMLASNIARWDGTRWNRLGGGTVGVVRTLAVHNGDLYAGGQLTGAGTTQVSNIARWNGSDWLAVGSGVVGPVYAIVPDGNSLLIGGAFTKAGGITANGIVRYAPATSTWQALGDGVGLSEMASIARVFAITVAPSGVYVGGDFRTAGADDNIVRRIAHWDGTTWDAMRAANETTGKGVGSLRDGEAMVNALATVGEDIYIGGMFQKAYMVVTIPTIHGDGTYFPYNAWHVVRWNPNERIWRSLGDAPNDYITTLVSDGKRLYMGGRFSSAGGAGVMNIASWSITGQGWVPLGAGAGGVGSVVKTISVAGEDVYAAVLNEYPELAGTGPRSSFIRHWNNTTQTWSTYGSQLNQLDITAMAATGTDVYVGGSGYDSLEAGLFRWNGTKWEAVGGGVKGRVYTIAIDGNWVYVGGLFSKAGNAPASNVARWNRTTGVWETLGRGVNSTVNSITFANGVVYVGGAFDTAGTVRCRYAASWDPFDGTWKALGAGVNAPIHVLAQREGIVYAAGEFETAGEVTAWHVASWDGEAWNSFGSGVNGPVQAMAIGSGGMFVAGSFDVAGNKPAYGLARWDNILLSVDAEPAVTGMSAELHCYPNPFSEHVTISFMLPVQKQGLLSSDSRTVHLSMCDAYGKIVATQEMAAGAGAHSVEWNGEGLPSGVYICRLEWPGGVQSTTLVKLR